MIETEYQRLVVNYVNSIGGFAEKMSNRFLVGVPDLFIKMPDGGPASFLEVKLDVLPVKLPAVTVAMTPKQYHWLRDSAAAGMTCNGCLSFVGSKDGKRLGAAVIPISAFVNNNTAALAIPVTTYLVRDITRQRAKMDRMELIEMVMQDWEGSRG